MALRDQLVSGFGGPQVWALCDALDTALDETRDALTALLEVPDLASDDLPPWALDVLGCVLNVERLASWSDADYLYALRAQAITRNSSGLLTELFELAIALSPLPGSGVATGPVYATAWIPGGSDLSTERQEILISAFLRAVPATAGLAVLGLPATLSDQVFTLDDPLRGLDRGHLADILGP